MRAPSTTMNSRVTKALLGTYSRRGPLFRVVYLAAARPRASDPAHACLSPALRPRRHASAPSARTGGARAARVLSRRMPCLPAAATTPSALAQGGQLPPGCPGAPRAALRAGRGRAWGWLGGRGAHRRSTFSQVPSNQDDGCAPPDDSGVAYVTATRSPSLNGCTANRKKPARAPRAGQQPAVAAP